MRAVRVLKLLTLACLKALGVFALARRLTARELRILAYHGIALADEDAFQGLLYMRPETFRRRVAAIARAGYPVLALDAALAALDRGHLPRCACVITIDDGWLGTYREALSPLEAHGFGATIYVATRYALSQGPVFDVAAGYLLWRARGRAVDLAPLGCGLGVVDAYDEVARRHAVHVLDGHFANAPAEAQSWILNTLARLAGVEAAAVLERGTFHLMNEAELAHAAARGFDLELHTHSHTPLIEDDPALARDIAENRAILEGITGAPVRHFCFPSGLHHHHAWPLLARLGVASATISAPGLNDARTPRYALRRFLDGETLSQIQFEAELSGVMEILRRARARLLPARSTPTAALPSPQTQASELRS